MDNIHNTQQEHITHEIDTQEAEQNKTRQRKAEHAHHNTAQYIYIRYSTRGQYGRNKQNRTQETYKEFHQGIIWKKQTKTEYIKKAMDNIHNTQQNRTHNRTEQNTPRSKTKQNKTHQEAKQNRTEQNNVKQNRTEQHNIYKEFLQGII